MQEIMIPSNSIRRGHNIYVFEKRSKKDKIYWVDHFLSYKSKFDFEDRMMGELLVSFDRRRIFNLWCDYPWKFTPEQKALFDKENPYWANFFQDRNGTDPPVSDEGSPIHFKD